MIKSLLLVTIMMIAVGTDSAHAERGRRNRGEMNAFKKASSPSSDSAEEARRKAFLDNLGYSEQAEKKEDERKPQEKQNDLKHQEIPEASAKTVAPREAPKTNESAPAVKPAEH
ncbi:MAG: hypothetical protein AB7G93_21160 [Bdellovibrionales bacterium]